MTDDPCPRCAELEARLANFERETFEALSTRVRELEKFHIGTPHTIELSFSITAEDSAISLAHVMVGKIDSPNVWCSDGFAVLAVSIQDNAMERACAAEAPWVTTISVSVIALDDLREGNLFISGMMHK